MVKKPDLFPDNWIYIHDPAVKVGRVQNFRSWSPEMVPAGMSCLGLEYFCFEGDELWNAADADLIALAKTEIAQIGLIDADDVVDACVVRQPKAYPVYDDAYRDNVAMIRLDLEIELSDAASRRPQRHAQIQQPGPRHDDRHADGAKHPGRRAHSTTCGTSTRTREYHEAGASGVQEALRSERLVPQRVKAGGQRLTRRSHRGRC